MGLIAAADFLNVKENRALKKISHEEASRCRFMRRIGVFELIDGVYIGQISTLNFKCKAKIQDNPYRKNPGEPEYVVMHNDSEELFHHDIGFAWAKKTDNDQNYLLVQLDDPAFPKTIMAVMVKGEENFYYLYWDRIPITDEDVEKLIITEELIPWIGVYRPIDKVTDFLIQAYPSLQEIWDPD